ncbi:MAG TPA: ABC transporter substrate-binding protein [Bryobacteraceae bacterium]|jgi:trehalose/maltose transport system substrate-binding protein|nr:ABC transporter substrate-binding protein [Bryobacteraceae bacterium]
MNISRRIAPVVFLAAFAGCHSPPNEPHQKAITVLLWAAGDAYRLDQQISEEFTRQTGIQVRLVPGSESASQRLQQELSLFRSGSGAVDVFQIDTIWTGILANYLVDLRSALKDELPDEQPVAIANATIAGRLVAAPFLIEYGMLYYRTDLLRKYGFSHPPHTWDELEMQSSRIQKGERREGQSQFWGYVWQGADYEGLTCNALEWQMSEGGGNMLEPNHTVDVDNPAAIRAFARAEKWVGSISPPGVVAYLEEDARNVWQSGRAAFMRNWSYVYRLALKSPEVRGRFSVAPMPAGVDPHSSALGGWYLGVSNRTSHLPEAIAFVKYMTGKEVQKKRAIGGAFLPTFRSLYRDPAVLAANPFFASVSGLPNRAVQRPAALAGAEYDHVSRAYAHGVHLILTGNAAASPETGAIQAEIARLTGLASNRPLVPADTNKEHR